MIDEHQIMQNVTAWIIECADYARSNLGQIAHIAQKSGEYDLVTNLDTDIEVKIEAQIHKHYPEASIIGEEATVKNIHQPTGLTFFIDPIDGTLNLVKKHDCFAIMIGVYDGEQPVCGAIMDVMKEQLYWGGPNIGVFCNDRRLPVPTDVALKDGLVGVSWRQFLGNRFNEIKIAQNSAGIRVMGSAGLEFIELMNGKHIAYLATLNPWDFAAGRILAETLGIKVRAVNGNQLNRFKTSHLIAGTPAAYHRIKMLQQF
ncbi:inositol monophosphatase family protein [Latilactobacillus curvatus]|uniref:inositol monophosphatase family protein n=1 Tax=Latilactobacillus curvatus TaxID=28038 RepID=UPI000FECC4AC|nr:inositol monophosphatase family protein [Latilactobacillus curvatus]QAR34686.1 inositol monophosphatase family protein [Latilactobacillus curvatus]